VTCIAPNVGEAARASGVAIVDEASLERAARTLLERLGCRYVLVTRGEAGMSLFGRDGEREQVPSVARTVFDVSGAGDTVVAVLTLALAARVPIATRRAWPTSRPVRSSRSSGRRRPRRPRSFH